MIATKEVNPLLLPFRPLIAATRKLLKELADFQDIFTPKSASILPHHKSTDHAINLKEGETPPYRPIYPLSPAKLNELWQYLDNSLAKGHIYPLKSPISIPILFVPKKDGSL